MGFKVKGKVALNKLDRRLFNTDVYVGYASDEAHHSGMSAAELGRLMTEGDGDLIPPRPHINEGLANSKHDIQAAIKRFAGGLFGIGAAPDAAERIGEVARQAVIDYVYSGELTPNAPFTIEKKGSDQPLVEQGELLHLLEARVVKGRL